MTFRLLGAVEVTVDGRPVGLGGRRQRAVLAVLLLHLNEVVGADRLVEEGKMPFHLVGTHRRVRLELCRRTSVVFVG